MTLFDPNRNRALALDMALDTIGQRSRKTIRLATVCMAVSLASIGGLTATDVAAHHDESCFPVHQNTRSIQMIESKEAPGGILAGSTAPPVRVPYEDSEHAVAQNRFASAAQDGEDDTADFAPKSQNQRSIELIEGRDPANVLTDSVASDEAAR